MDSNNILKFSITPTESTPVFAETKADWIPYGSDNLYPDFLINLRNTSSKHNSLLRKKVNMSVGEGFTETPANAEFIANTNGKEDLNDIVFKNGVDLTLYGGYALAVTWSNDGSKIVRTSFVDFSKVRIAKVLEDDSEVAQLQEKGVDFYYISADWSQYRKTKYTPELIQGFSETEKKAKTQLIYVTEYMAGVDFYTYPDYLPAINWISLDYEISNFHLSSTRNGFTPSMVISMRGGVPSKEERKALKKDLMKEYAGTDNGSNVIMTFSESGDTAPEFTPINLNASDDRFLQLEEQIQQNIIIAHGASPIVAGVAISGKLGSSDEVIESEQVFQKNVIDAKQKIIQRSYDKILKVNGINEEIELRGIKSFDEVKKVEDGDK
jgi:hypothetical protein